MLEVLDDAGDRWVIDLLAAPDFLHEEPCVLGADLEQSQHYRPRSRIALAISRPTRIACSETGLPSTGSRIFLKLMKRTLGAL